MPSVDRIYGVSGEVAIKVPCVVATTANVTLSGLQTIDGVLLTSGQRVCVWQQTDDTENGIYAASSTGWVREPDFDGARDVVTGTLVRILSGSTYGGVFLGVTTTNPIPGQTSIDFQVENSATLDATLPKLVNNVAAVKALDASIYPEAQTKGYYAAKDGGHGHYYFILGDATTANDFTVFADNANTGRWFLFRESVLNVKQAGAKGDDATYDVAALQAAVDYFDVSTPRQAGEGGQIHVPKGIYRMDTKWTVPAGVMITCDGFGTVFKSYYAGFAIQLGHDNGDINYNAGLENCEILLMINGAHGVSLFNAVSCWCRNIRVQNEGGGTNNQAFVIDGGQSGFFNLLMNCYGLGCSNAFILTVSSGPSYPTTSVFIDCNGHGADIVGSKGFYFDSNYGLDSVILGGNMEHYDTGIELVSTQGLTVFGLRFEANTLDVKLGTFAQQNAFIGCKNLNTLQHSTQNGYSKNTFFGNTGNGAAVNNNSIERPFTLLSPSATDTPLTIQGYASQTADLQRILNSAGSLLTGLTASGYQLLGAGRITTSYGSGSPEGLICAPKGSHYHCDDGGANTSFYVKEAVTAKAVTGATQANPVVITAAGHGFSNGNRVRLTSVGGMTQINHTLANGWPIYTIAGVTANTFQLSGIDGTGYGAYTSGGSAEDGTGWAAK